jgi:hypothetical protein
MNPLLQQLPALLGVLVGALAAYVATMLSERARWRRERLSRHEERRLKVYGDYALAVKRELSVILHVAAGLGLPGSADSAELEEGRRLIKEAEAERTVAWESVLLVGSDAAVVAGRAWHDAVGRMYQIASGRDDASWWAAALRATSAARREFYAVVRVDVGNKPSEDPAIYEWQVNKLLNEAAESSGGEGT